jgi:hypothetical protein
MNKTALLDSDCAHQKGSSSVLILLYILCSWLLFLHHAAAGISLERRS